MYGEHIEGFETISLYLFEECSGLVGGEGGNVFFLGTFGGSTASATLRGTRRSGSVREPGIDKTRKMKFVRTSLCV
jgi:hypothetical protein